jgi:hypothetical protein
LCLATYHVQSGRPVQACKVLSETVRSRSQGYTRKRITFAKKRPHSLSYFQITAQLSERRPLHPSSALRCLRRSPAAGAHAAPLHLGGRSLCRPFVCSHLASYLNILPCVCSSTFVSLSSPCFYSSSPPLLLFFLSLPWSSSPIAAAVGWSIVAALFLMRVQVVGKFVTWPR